MAQETASTLTMAGECIASLSNLTSRYAACLPDTWLEFVTQRDLEQRVKSAASPVAMAAVAKELQLLTDVLTARHAVYLVRSDAGMSEELEWTWWKGMTKSLDSADVTARGAIDIARRAHPTTERRRQRRKT
jgi:hypothetical protein